MKPTWRKVYLWPHEWVPQKIEPIDPPSSVLEEIISEVCDWDIGIKLTRVRRADGEFLVATDVPVSGS